MNASISLTQILDIIPQACRIIVNCGGIEILCQKIQNIEYIDVAESAIRALEKVSVEYGPSILECGGMETMLNFLDFFVSATQVIFRDFLDLVEIDYEHCFQYFQTRQLRRSYKKQHFARAPYDHELCSMKFLRFSNSNLRMLTRPDKNLCAL